MIHGIKIYKGDGTLKEELSSEKALQHYNKNNESNWVLSPSERHWWKGLKLDDLPKKSSHKPRWLQKTYKKQIPTYKVTCTICGKETVKVSQDAKYCGTYCYGVSRRKSNNERYHRMKNQKNSASIT